DPPLSAPFSDNLYPLCVSLVNLCTTEQDNLASSAGG
ncbi:MAG: hypothetical protein HW418_1748, partial [Anaerolineales bacterium]|nr:hypothetical protein [Anaerolineales bacterium]